MTRCFWKQNKLYASYFFVEKKFTLHYETYFGGINRNIWNERRVEDEEVSDGEYTDKTWSQDMKEGVREDCPVCFQRGDLIST